MPSQIFSALSKGNKVFKDTTDNNTFNVGTEATKVIISGKMTSGDVINVEGLANEYTVRASGRTVTLKSDTQTITFQLASGTGAAKVVFLDGSLNAAVGAKGAITLGGQKLSSKYAEVSETGLVDTDSSSTALDTAYAAVTGGSSSGGSSSGGSSSGGSTFTLTSSIDSPGSTSGDDVYLGDNNTTSAADQINGGNGTIR